MTKHLIIVNPVAGKGAGEQSIPTITNRLTELGLEFDLVRTERPWHAAELAQQACQTGYEAVVAVGGDGTSNEVLNGLMQAKQNGLTPCKLGVLCVGRGNDFAYGMGIPTDLEEGCLTLAHGYPRTIDVGHVAGGDYPEGRYFGNGLGIGFDAVVGFEAAKFKRLGGFVGYLVAALKTIYIFYPPPKIEVTYDDQHLIDRLLMVSIMNGRRMGGGFLMAPDGQPDDGQFHLCIANQVPRLRIFGLIGHFTKGTQATQPTITMGRATRVSVTALDGSLPVHADGETICTAGEQLSLTLHPA